MMYQITECCRTCLRMECPLTHTSTRDRDNVRLIDKLSACVSDVIWQRDRYSLLICIFCIEKLRTAYDFQKLCVDSDNTLKRYLNNQEHSKHGLCDDRSLATPTKFDYSLQMQIQNNVELQNDYLNLRSLLEDSECSAEASRNQCVIDTREALGIIPLQIIDGTSTEQSPSVLETQMSISANQSKPNTVSTETQTPYALMTQSNNPIPAAKIAQKRYPCNICNKDYSNYSNLQSHKKSHLGEKPFECKYCDKRFLHSHHLREHIRRHTGEKPFACSLCSKRFTIRGEVTMHMRSHTGEKPYACTLCDKKCSTHSDLKVHTRTHTEMGWSQEHVQALIECYRANECLYMVTSPWYKNKHARSAVLQQIVECLKSLGRKCTIAEIKSKWNGLRTNYLSECRKYESTQKSGAGADDILKPSLWYFDLMRFIDKYSNPRQSIDVLDITAIIDNKNDEINNGNGEVVFEYMDESDIENHNSSFSPPAAVKMLHLLIQYNAPKKHIFNPNTQWPLSPWILQQFDALFQHPQDHSPIYQSLMHSVYHEPTSPFNAEDFELSDHDQLPVASLYRQRKIKKTSKITTMATKRTFPPPHSSPPAKQPEKKKKKDDTPPDLCKIEGQLDMFLVFIKKKKWMLYAEQHWTKVVDLKSAVERLYEKLGALEFDADHEAIYGMEKYYTVEKCENLRDKYKIGRKTSDSDTSSYSSDEEECKEAVDQNGEDSKTTEEDESKKSEGGRITKPVS
ncbi:hypothetical protein FQA39_LY16488 [Lamprigera yunnana]|nr:hypothetical protein FQA39_LY16488 [Lamprigera yunnana]